MLRHATMIVFVVIACSCKAPKPKVTSYNGLAYGKTPGLAHDGYVIGIEKMERRRIHAPKQGAPQWVTQLPLKGDKTECKRIRTLNKQFRDRTDDGKRCLLTHIIGRNGEKSETIFNAHDDPKQLRYQTGFAQLANLEAAVLSQLDTAATGGEPYTHILVMSMGWNNNQEKSIWRFNKIVSNLKGCAGKQVRFKPMVLGITWPSVWGDEANWLGKKLGHVPSYANKCNDADEIGYIIANVLINQHVRKLKQHPSKPRIVLIGHSMGARLLSRALFSDGHLKQQTAAPQVDLFVGVQGAFSVNRFLPGKGREGAPYAESGRRATVIALTSSEHDKANPVARFASGAKHVGSESGLKTAGKSGRFKIITWPKPAKKSSAFEQHGIVELPSGEKPLMIDASEIVKKNSSTGMDGDAVSAHNDILDKELAMLLLELIQKYAPAAR